MQTNFHKELYINMTHCDHTSHLGIPQTFGIFLDLATEHAESLGIGTKLIREKHIFWVTGRTRAHFYRKPSMTELVQAETFMGPGRGPRAARYYRLFTEGEILVEGKTDFVATNLATGQLERISDFYPTQDEITENLKNEILPLSDPAPRISPDFSEASVIGSYTVRSTDIDLGGHMNNVAYLWAIAGLFSSKDLDSASWTDVDIAYRKPCYEGETLTARLRRLENVTELALTKPEGEAAVLIRLS